jgi:Family of unknown function (DUF6496)
MARKYSKSASKDVERAMRKRKRGTLKSGSGQTVKSRKQAVAIGLSEAPQEGQEGAEEEKGELARGCDLVVELGG